MIRELDTVLLKHDIGKHSLRRGDVGTVVHSYSDGTVFEVEFVTVEGKTIALLTLTHADIRLLGKRGILHVRELAYGHGA